MYVCWILGCGCVELIHLQRRTGMISRHQMFSNTRMLAKPLLAVLRVLRYPPPPFLHSFLSHLLGIFLIFNIRYAPSFVLVLGMYLHSFSFHITGSICICRWCVCITTLVFKSLLLFIFIFYYLTVGNPHCLICRLAMYNSLVSFFFVDFFSRIISFQCFLFEFGVCCL